MEIKGIHIDLKAQTMRFDFLMQTVDELADMGFNTLLLEYQDKFPYSGELACLAAPDALTLEEIEQLKALCKRRGLAIIPLVQCIGHMYWVTRFPAFQALGEHYSEKGPGSHSLCASRKESLELFYSLCQQVFRVHPDSRYFHIGGDEVKFSDSCPLCAGNDQGALLGAYYQNVLAFISGSGYTPVMWGDMVVKYAQIASFLPAGTLIMDWEYRKGLTARNQKRFYGTAEPFSPADETAFANTPKLLQQGFSVLTAPALRSMGDSCFLPSAVHLDNCVQGYYTAADHNAAGIIVTSWSVRRSPWQLTRPVLWVISALFREDTADCDTALAAYAQKAFGIPDPELGKLPFRLALAIRKAKDTADFLSSGQDFMDPGTGMFLSDSMEKRLKGVDIRNNEAVRNAYAQLQETAACLKQQLQAVPCASEDAKMLLWALDNALFLSDYVVDLCDRYADPHWLRQQLLKFDAFRSQVDVLRQYYTDFSMPSEYQSRIDIHKEFLNSLLHSA